MALVVLRIGELLVPDVLEVSLENFSTYIDSKEERQNQKNVVKGEIRT
jgi:hypothetical protein